MGDKWRYLKDDDKQNIEAISMEFKRYQNPKDADKLTKAIGEVEETKVILHDSIKKLL
jgi:hypothetical protein